MQWYIINIPSESIDTSVYIKFIFYITENIAFACVYKTRIKLKKDPCDIVIGRIYCTVYQGPKKWIHMRVNLDHINQRFIEAIYVSEMLIKSCIFMNTVIKMSFPFPLLAITPCITVNLVFRFGIYHAMVIHKNSNREFIIWISLISNCQIL